VEHLHIHIFELKLKECLMGLILTLTVSVWHVILFPSLSSLYFFKRSLQLCFTYCLLRSQKREKIIMRRMLINMTRLTHRIILEREWDDFRKSMEMNLHKFLKIYIVHWVSKHSSRSWSSLSSSLFFSFIILFDGGLMGWAAGYNILRLLEAVKWVN
jgi:hypothetical protein